MIVEMIVLIGFILLVVALGWILDRRKKNQVETPLRFALPDFEEEQEALIKDLEVSDLLENGQRLLHLTLWLKESESYVKTSQWVNQNRTITPNEVVFIEPLTPES